MYLDQSETVSSHYSITSSSGSVWSFLGPVTAPRYMSAENDAVVSEKLQLQCCLVLLLSHLRLFVIASSSAGLVANVTSFAVADIGANNPNAAGATASF